MSAKLKRLVGKTVENAISNLNTLMICRVVQTSPYLEILPYFDAQYADGEIQQRTKIQKPITMQGASFQVNDVVLVGFLQEFVEGGAARRFDISDAVIIGKVSI